MGYEFQFKNIETTQIEKYLFLQSWSYKSQTSAMPVLYKRVAQYHILLFAGLGLTMETHPVDSG